MHSLLSLIISFLASQNVTSLCRYPQLILTTVQFSSSLFDSGIFCQMYSSETNIEPIQISSVLCRYTGKSLQITFPQTLNSPIQINVNKTPFVRGNYTGCFNVMVTELMAICGEDSFSTDMFLICLACIQSDRNCLKVV